MNVRRVVAGNDSQGKSVFLSDGVAPASYDFEFTPGQSLTRVWFTSGQPTVTHPLTEPTEVTAPVLPPPGGASFLIVQHAPESVVTDPRFDAAQANIEFATYAPDVAATFEVNEPGMHQTPTVDYGIVLDGEIWLELDDGAETRLTRGDTFVQIGGRHAWRNKTERPATVAFILTGAIG